MPGAKRGPDLASGRAYVSATSEVRPQLHRGHSCLNSLWRSMVDRSSSFRSFACLNCQAFYHVVTVEAGPETALHDVACRACGAAFPGREGSQVGKYLMLRKAGRTVDQGAKEHKKSSVALTRPAPLNRPASDTLKICPPEQASGPLGRASEEARPDAECPEGHKR
jgi:hypothetical protein